jgi:hypothetical protein
MGNELNERFKKIFPYLIKHGKLPGAPAFFVDEVGCYQIVDGCHRVSLYLGLRRDFSGTIRLKDNQDIIVGRQEMLWSGTLASL